MKQIYLTIDGFVQPTYTQTNVWDNMTVKDLKEERIWDDIVEDIFYRFEIDMDSATNIYADLAYELEVEIPEGFEDFVIKYVKNAIDKDSFKIVKSDFCEYDEGSRSEFGWDYILTTDIDLVALLNEFNNDKQ